MTFLDYVVAEPGPDGPVVRGRAEDLHGDRRSTW